MKTLLMVAVHCFGLGVWLIASQARSAEPTSNPIVDVRFDGPYGQVEPSFGDEWAPTWGRDDVLYTGNDDGSSFGGVPSNTMAFGKLLGSDPYNLKGITISGMLGFKEPNLTPEDAHWKSLDSYKVGEVFYRFLPCSGDRTAQSTCLATSGDGRGWREEGKALFKGARFSAPRFIIWSKKFEQMMGLKPREHVYVASYAGVIDGEDQYLIAKAPTSKLRNREAADWSFRIDEFRWGALHEARPMSGNGTVGPDGANWKATNTYSVDGVLYMFVSRCIYPWKSTDSKRRHVWRNSSVIKSTDNGLTWTRSPEENYTNPMFPGERFGTAYFVWYGKDGAASVDNADKYVYAISNNGHFENGDNYVLGRVPRSKLPQLSAADWSFYTTGDGMREGSWTAKLEAAQPILSEPGRLSMTGMTYIPHLRRYVLVSWHYNQANFEAAMKANDMSTVIAFYEAPQPWGPWTKIKSYDTGTLGWYVPVVGQRFQIASGPHNAKAFLYPTGLSNQAEGGLNFELYKFNYIPITLSTAHLKHENPSYVGGR